MREAGEGSAVRQLEVALSAFERLDRRLLVDREHYRVLRRVQVETDDIGGLGRELGVGRKAPGFTPGKVDALRAQETPDMLIANIAKLPRNERRCPAGETRRWCRSSNARMRRSALAP